MAQKKITVELTVVEAAHVIAALNVAREEHESNFKKKNPVLERVATKLIDSTSGTDQKEEKDDEDPGTDG